MKAYIITYDLNRPGQDYPALWKEIKSYETYYRLQGSVWIIRASQSAERIRDHLQQYIDQNDSLLIAKLSGEAAWIGDLDSDWLKDVLNQAAYS